MSVEVIGDLPHHLVDPVGSVTKHLVGNFGESSNHVGNNFFGGSWTMPLPHHHRHIADFAIGNPTVLVLEVPRRNTGCFTQ